MEKGVKIGIIICAVVVLLFVLSLFYACYGCGGPPAKTAQQIAKLEVTRISKEIGGTIDFKGMSNSIIYLKKTLTVGREEIPYSFKISDSTEVSLALSGGYHNIIETASFESDLKKVGDTTIECGPYDLQNGAQLEVSKTSDYSYNTTINALIHTRTADIKGCGGQITFEQVSVEK